MVGLSVVLENQKSGDNINIIISKKTPQIISKTTSDMFINTTRKACSSSSSSSCLPVSPSFLQQCFLCKQKLLPAKDIYMYKGDRGFCSVECRCKQILMDDEEEISKEAKWSSASTQTSRRHRKAAGSNRAGGFGY